MPKIRAPLLQVVGWARLSPTLQAEAEASPSVSRTAGDANLRGGAMPVGDAAMSVTLAALASLFLCGVHNIAELLSLGEGTTHRATLL